MTSHWILDVLFFVFYFFIIQDHVCLHIKVLSRTNLDLSVFQVCFFTLFGFMLDAEDFI